MSERLRRCSRFAVLASVSAGLIGAVALGAWLLDSQAATRSYPGFFKMKVNTALCLVLSALALVASGALSSAARKLAQFGAIVVFAIGALTLLEWLSGLDLAIDELLCRDWTVPVAASFPGRMAPTTALCLALLAAAMLLDARTRGPGGKLARGLAAGVACIAFVSVVGYIYGVGPTFGLARYATQMALHTAFALLLLASAALATAPNDGLARLLTSATSAGVLVRWLMPAAIVLPIALGWIRLVGQQRGLYGTELGLALFASANVVTFTALVIWSAQAVRRQDEALHRAHDELENRVQERTVELGRANSALERQMMERARAERELVESSALWRSILDSANLSVIATTPDGIIREFNATAARWLDYRPEEMIGRATPAILHDPQEVADRSKRLSVELGRPIEPGFEAFVAKARLGVADENEWTYCPKSRPRFPVLLSVTAIRAANGEITGFVGVASDLTQRREAEQEIIELRIALENAVEGIALLDERGVYSTVNGAYAASAGWTPEELAGKPWQVTVHTDDHPRLSELLGTVSSAGKVEAEALGLCRDGATFHTRIVMIPAFRRDGSLRGHYWFSKDISARKHIERELIRAKEAAEAAMRARSDFLARMSHEIRTPMNGVLGMIRLAFQTALTDEQRDYLEVARSSAEGLLILIDDVLDFSKIDAGKLRLEAVSFELRECLAGVVRGFAPRAHAKGLEIVLDTEASVPRWVRGDPQRLQQVLVNLVSNAVKFTERGEVALIVTARAESAASVELLFLVRDTGIGIPKEKQALVFDAFAQADEATTRRFGGTGLGLTICSELVQLMGGSLRLDSTPGAGSTFSVTLRLDVAAENAREAQAPLPPLQDQCALVVDDHATSRRVVCDLLRAWRMTVVGATAEDAVALVRARDGGFTLLLVDDVSASRQAPDFIRQLRGDDPRARPLVLLAHATDPNAGGGVAAPIEHPASARVLKPVSASGLLEAIQAVSLGGRDPEASGHDDPPPERGPRRRILLVEDNAVNRKVALALLSKAGHDVVPVETGRGALETLARESFDVVLMDVQMPEMDGIEATRAIRELERATSHRTPIVALTAQAMQGDRARCLEAGMDGYVSKPIEPKELLAEMERVIRHRPPEHSPALTPKHDPRPAPFDSAAALRQLGGDWALLGEVIAVFRSEEGALLETIRDAAANADARGVEHGAHKLKGALLNLAAQPAAKAALVLEESSRRGALPTAAEIERLATGLAELRSALSQFQQAPVHP